MGRSWPVRLVAAALMLVAVGQLLERSVPMDALDVIPRSIRNPGVDRTALALASGGRFVHHVAVLDEAPGATIILDGACGLREELAFRYLAGARAVIRLDLAPFAIESLEPVGAAVNRSDRWLSTRWGLALDDPPVEAIAVRCRGDVLDMVDLRLIPADVLGAASTRGMALPVEVAERPRSILYAILIESGLLLLALLVGGLLLPSTLPLALRLPLGLLTGLSLQTLAGLVLLSGAWTPILGLGLLVAAVAGRRELQERGFGWMRADLPGVGVATLVVALAAGWMRTRGTFAAHTDSLEYLLGARALATGDLGVRAVDAKRGVAQQVLHAPAFSAGIEWLQALNLLALIAGILLLVLAQRTVVRHRGALLPLLGAAVIVTAGQTWRFVAVVNAHVLVAALLLALVVLWWARTAGAHQVEPAAATIAAGLTLLRPEGVLFVGALLVSLLSLDGRVRWAWVWVATGATTLAQGALFALAGGWPASAVPTTVILPMALGALIVAFPFVARLLSGEAARRALQRSPIVTAAALWTFAAAVLLVGSGGVRFVRNLEANLLRGDGGWGILGVVLLSTAVVVAIGGDPTVSGSRRSALLPLRWWLITLPPVTVIAKLADAGTQTSGDVGLLALMSSAVGNVGWFDSTNRILFHASLVVFAILSLETIGRGDRPDGTVDPSPTLQRLPAIVAVLLVGAVVLLWDPLYAGAGAARPLLRGVPAIAGVMLLLPLAGRWGAAQQLR